MYTNSGISESDFVARLLTPEGTESLRYLLEEMQGLAISQPRGRRSSPTSALRLTAAQGSQGSCNYPARHRRFTPGENATIWHGKILLQGQWGFRSLQQLFWHPATFHHLSVRLRRECNYLARDNLTPRPMGLRDLQQVSRHPAAFHHPSFGLCQAPTRLDPGAASP